MALGPAASVSTREMQILGSCPRPMESDTLGVDPANCVLARPSGIVMHARVCRTMVMKK